MDEFQIDCCSMMQTKSGWEPHKLQCELWLITFLPWVSSASKGQWAANKAQATSAVHVFRKLCLSSCFPSDVSVAVSFQFNQPVLWAQSAGLTGWTPVSWWTPASPAGFWSRSARRPRRCWPRTWPASVGTSPSCAPGKQKSCHLLLQGLHLSKVIIVCFKRNYPKQAGVIFIFQGSWKDSHITPQMASVYGCHALFDLSL